MKSHIAASFALLATPFVLGQNANQRVAESPLDNLPEHIEVLTHFGERADFSPDNEQVAFMAKSFGDAMVIDLETRQIRCLTCNVPGAAFLRVMHLANSDYLLFGPDHFEDIETSRWRDNELWYLSKQRGSKPIKLGIKLNEGAAVSKTDLKIAFAQGSRHAPNLEPGATQIVVADLILDDGPPRVLNQNIVFKSPDRNCVVEAQDFFDNDTKLTFSCYEPNNMASVMSLDLATGEITNHTPQTGTYNEPEGILPGGAFTLVESDQQTEVLGGRRGPWNIDIWKLSLLPDQPAFERITHFNDFVGGKASNPVVSTDGKLMAFQHANNTDPAGVGYGILLYRLAE